MTAAPLSSDARVVVVGDCARLRAGEVSAGSVRVECRRAALDGGTGVAHAVRAAGLMIAAGSAPAVRDLADPATDPMGLSGDSAKN